LKKILLLIIFLFPVICCHNGKESKQKNEITPVSREGAENFILVDLKGDKRNWVLKAGRGDSYGDSVKIFGVTVEFYDSNGKYNSTLTSDSGVVYSVSGNMTASGEVQVVSKDSTVLKTNSLDWDNKKQKIVTEDFVEITREHTIITGKGMESDPNLEHIEIKEDFNATSRDVKEDEE